MISVLITAYKEPKTIGRAISAFLDSGIKDMEILVIAPDNETLDVAKKYKHVKIVKEPAKKGKPAALNMGLKHVSKKSKILVLSDGDVYIGKDALYNLLAPFKDKKVGAVTGRPVSLNPKKSKFGYWAYILTQIAHERRQKASKEGKRFFCSGYLFAIRKELFPNLPEELLSEDGYISHKVYEKGCSLAYSPESKVFVNYPTNFSDWIKQKRRSTGGYNQNYKLLGVRIRSFSSESAGFASLFKYISSPKELLWLLQLSISRLYLWLLIYKDINLMKKSREELWVPIESTK